MAATELPAGGGIPPAGVRTIITEFGYGVTSTPAGGRILILMLPTGEQLLVMFKHEAALEVGEAMIAPSVIHPNNHKER